MKKRRDGRRRLPPFVAMTWELLNSKAFKDLNFAPAKALPYFIGKYRGDYNDSQRYFFEFPLSYSEAKRYGFSSSTFYKVIQKLVSMGFIDPVDKGGLRSDGKSYNLFRLSRRWEKYGTQDFKSIEWKCFIPRQRATPKSETYSFKKGNDMPPYDQIVSQTEAVGGVLR